MNQPDQIAHLESAGWTFSHWIAARPDADGGAMDEQQTAVLTRHPRRGITYYADVEPDGTLNL